MAFATASRSVLPGLMRSVLPAATSLVVRQSWRWNPMPVRSIFTGPRSASSQLAVVAQPFDAQDKGIPVHVQGATHHLLPQKLRRHCPCPQCREASSGQRLNGDDTPNHELASFHAHELGLDVLWADGHASHFSNAWLERLLAYRPTLQLVPPPHCKTILECDFEWIMETEDGLYEWLLQLARDGASIVKGSPSEERTVCRLADRISQAQPTIYGDVFDVVSSASPINIAYTSHELGLHQDLAYYESAPGLQFLHCMRFDESVQGGLSLLVDAFEVAERLYKQDPFAFDVLCRIPASFEKDHTQRKLPVGITYSRPHITVNPRNEVTSVTWSPPFEAPLQGVSVDDEHLYYRAYDAFQTAIKDCTNHRLRLHPGDIMTFNNRRMLHGRTGFSSPDGGVRHLQGCYVNIDEFQSRFRTLRDKRDPSVPLYHVGNQNMI